MRKRSAQTGLSLVETIAAAFIAAAMLAAGAVITSSLRSASAAQVKRGAMRVRAADVADRIVRELSVAGTRGEDRNGNGALDAGEDTNLNARLDADWNLADGASAAAITFNTVERASWRWSAPVTWRLDAGTLVRTGANGVPVEVARGVQSFTVTRAGDEVTVRLVLAGPDAAGRTWSETAERRVYVRN